MADVPVHRLRAPVELDGAGLPRDMAVDVSEEQSRLRLVLRELPKRKCLLVLLIVVVNMGILTYLRGRAISRKRRIFPSVVFIVLPGETFEETVDRAYPPRFIPPWQWTANEWRETFPWN
jgi:hypothetical protein